MNANGKAHIIKVSHLSANGSNAVEGSSHDDSSSCTGHESLGSRSSREKTVVVAVPVTSRLDVLA